MNNNSFKLRSSKNILRDLFFVVIIIIIIIIIGLVINISYHNYRVENEQLFISLNYCKNVKRDAKDVKLEIVDECLGQLNKSKPNMLRNSMIDEINNIKAYVFLRDEINTFFEKDILKSNTKLDDLQYYYNRVKQLPDQYKDLLLPYIEEMETQYTKINLLTIFVNNMYESDSKENIKSEVTREEYNQSLEAYNDVIQEDIKQEYYVYIERVNNYLTEKERIEEERRRQEAIKNAWVRLNVPYISQNHNFVFNGCEAASVLMALKYKGYLLDMDLATYSTNMPKSDDPNLGFYLDIFGKEPKTEAHWIAPKPLKEYAISSSGNNNIIDATGWPLDSLSEEIINNNPVVIYLTYDFLEPYNWSKGVPKNLHVLLLTGYNTITNQYFIMDPYTRSNGVYQFTLSKERIEYLYNTVGKRALVIR